MDRSPISMRAACDELVAVVRAYELRRCRLAARSQTSRRGHAPLSEHRPGSASNRRQSTATEQRKDQR